MFVNYFRKNFNEVTLIKIFWLTNTLFYADKYSQSTWIRMIQFRVTFHLLLILINSIWWYNVFPFKLHNHISFIIEFNQSLVVTLWRIYMAKRGLNIYKNLFLVFIFPLGVKLKLVEMMWKLSQITSGRTLTKWLWSKFFDWQILFFTLTNTPNQFQIE